MDFRPAARTHLRQIVRTAQLGQADDQAAVPFVVVLDGRLADRDRRILDGDAPATRQRQREDQHDALHRVTSAKATSLPYSSSSSCIARPLAAQVTQILRGA